MPSKFVKYWAKNDDSGTRLARIRTRLARIRISFAKKQKFSLGCIKFGGPACGGPSG